MTNGTTLPYVPDLVVRMYNCCSYLPYLVHSPIYLQVMFSRLAIAMSAAAAVCSATLQVCYFTYETASVLEECPPRLAGACVCHDHEENPGVSLDSLEDRIVSINGIPNDHEVLLYGDDQWKWTTFLARHDGPNPDTTTGQSFSSIKLRNAEAPEKDAKSAVVLKKMDDNIFCYCVIISNSLFHKHDTDR